ncbi:MAG: Fic family protein [Tepidisphaeraceae bacterium]|jgi:Fic family protein
MMTLVQFSKGVASVPTSTAWYLADLGQAIGHQELFTRQSPQRLKVLREHALIESAVSSNRIEGVEVDQKRIATLMFGKPLLKDREEEEVRGYRDALNLIHTKGAKLEVSEKTIRRLHEMIRGDIWDAGQYKEKDGEIIEKYANGRQRVRFRPTPARQTPKVMADLLARWHECRRERWVHPLVAMAAFNLDFLCIHPFRDGNGRVSRLLLLLQCYHLGVEVGRYISLERLIEENKERYYEMLETCSRGWHEGKHDPWPYINHLLYILKTAYGEFEERVGQTAEPKGAKAELVREAVNRQLDEFRLADIERACPGVGREWIRVVLGELREEGAVVCRGRGPGARWRRSGNKGSTPK